MVAITNRLSPVDPGEDERPPQTRVEWEGDDLAELTNSRVQFGIAENGTWLLEASTSLRYYRSDQYRRNLRRKDRDRIRVVANFIRRDIDRMVNEVLDGDPVINPSARHPKHTDFARLLLHVLEWTRDEEENYEENSEDCITDCFHIGEGCWFEGWDQDADEGRGLPRGLWVDSRYVIPDPGAREFQRDDGEWMIWLEDRKTSEVKSMYPVLKDVDLNYENPTNYLHPHLRSYMRGKGGKAGAQRKMAHSEDRVWIKRMWHKKQIVEKRYWWSDDASPATILDETGEEVMVTEENYDQLEDEMKDQVVETQHPTVEMWESVVVSDMVVEHRLSPFDKSKNGHGRFPFCWFPCIRLRDESRARGEISYMIGFQDVRNEAISAMLDQMFIANIGYIHSFRGSVPQDQKEKIPRIGRDPLTLIETMQGIEPPTFQGYNPTGAQLFSSTLPLLKDIASDISGIDDVARAEVPGQVQSGRAIRALMARQNQLGTKVRRHIESGLERQTLLRLHNIAQFMRGNRYLGEITDPNDDREKVLFIGFSEEEVASVFSLQQQPAGDAPQEAPVPGQMPDMEQEMEWVTEAGKPAEILVLNDETTRDVVFNKIRLTLDTSREASKLEKIEQSEMVLNAVGPAAIPWVAKEQDWNNADELVEAIEKHDMAQQLAAQLEEVSKASGIPAPQLIEMLTASVQGGVTPGPVPPGQPQPQPGPPAPGAPPPPPAAGVAA